MFNRYHTEIAEDYWNREYLDYTDNNWYHEQHFVRIMIPILEKLLTELGPKAGLNNR